MGTPYSTVAVTGYNSSPPSDDGTQVDSNKVYWSTAKTKLGDPLNTAIAAIDSALVTAFNYTAAEKTADYTTVAGDAGKIIEIGSTVSSAVTITLGQVASMGTSYIVKVVNRSTIAQTVARGGSDTINGSLTSLTIPSKASLTFQVNASNNGYDVIAAVGYMPGTLTVDGTTTLTGVATLTAQPVLSSLTASQAVFTDGSKGLVSNAITGSGNVVMSTSPTFATSVIGSATMAVFNSASTTVNAFGAATTLNIGNSGGTNTVLGATTFSQALTANGLLSANAILAVSKATAGDVATFTNGGASNKTLSIYSDAQYVAMSSGALGGGEGVTFDVTNHKINLNTNSALRVSIDASGMNGALGQTTPAAGAFTTGAFSGITTITTADDVQAFKVIGASGQVRIAGYLAGLTSPAIQGVTASGSAYSTLTLDGSSVKLAASGTAVAVASSAGIAVTGTVNPSADNTYSCGTGALRWSVVYAATGAINTSDAREKTAVSPMTSAEIEASKQLAREIGTYKWLSAVAEKGEAARKHVGFTVQRAVEIMQSNGLDPMAYGFICYDQWNDEFVEHPAIEAKDAVLDEDGNVIEAAIEPKPAWTEQTQHAGDRYAFRYDELNMFIARGFEARIAALEDR